MIGFFIENKQFSAAAYTLRALGRMIGVDLVEVNDARDAGALTALIVYGRRIPESIPETLPTLLMAQDDYDRSKSLTAADVREIESLNDEAPSLRYLFACDVEPLPVALYRDIASGKTMISRRANRVHIAADVPATCFYFLSLENERRTPQRDRFQRFQRNFSPLGEEAYEYPIVDRYAALLRRLLADLAPGEVRSLWPRDTSFAVALSHDVDRIRTWTFRKARRALRGKGRGDICRRATGLLRSIAYPENWRGNFDFISRLENKYNAASTFFMVSAHRCKLDPAYKLSSPRLRRGMARARERGCSFGLHGTIDSAARAGLLAGERDELQRYAGEVRGGRQHYLRFTDETPQRWLEAGLRYDSTLGFASHTGWRCGASLPFYVHDGKKELPIVEIPLILMDTVLFLESKQSLSAAKAWRVIEQHLQETKQNNGLLTINWHNSDLHPYDVHGYSQLYERILQWTQENGGWLASVDAVYDWWIRK